MATVENTIILRDRMSTVVDNITLRMRRMGQESSDAGQQARNGLQAAQTAAEHTRGSFEKMTLGIMALRDGIDLLRGGLESLKNVTEVADAYTQINARLGLIVSKGETVVQIQDKIHASAERARGSYNDMAGAVSKIALSAGKAFNNNNDQIIAFTELLQKSFVIGGTSAENQAAGILQISQALSAGKLQGDEFNSVMENAPIYAQKIKDYLHLSAAEFTKLKEAGGITADIMKNAMFKSAIEINDMFGKIPETFGEAFVIAKDKALKALQPLFIAMNNWLNTGGASRLTEIFINLAQAANAVGGAILFIANNWSRIAPYLVGTLVVIASLYAKVGTAALIAGLKATGAFIAANWPLLLLVGTIATLISFWDKLGRAAQIAGVVIVLALLAIQLAALEVTFPFLIIIGVIALAIAAFVLFKDQAIEALGYIGGAIGVLVALIYNEFASVANYFVSVAEFFVNVWTNPIYSVKKLFVNLAADVIGIIGSIAGAIDKVLGTNMSGALTNIQNKMNTALGKQPDNYVSLNKFQYMDVSGAAEKGYGIGKGVGNDIGGALSGIQNKMKDLVKPPAMNVPNGTPGDPINTKVQGKVSIDQEDLRFMRDIARVKFINQYTTLRPSVKATFGDVRETADINGIVSALAGIMENSTSAALS